MTTNIRAVIIKPTVEDLYGRRIEVSVDVFGVVQMPGVDLSPEQTATLIGVLTEARNTAVKVRAGLAEMYDCVSCLDTRIALVSDGTAAPDREVPCPDCASNARTVEFHELVFTDREARPAKWETRCGRTDVPLTQTLSPAPGSHYQVTCPDCVAKAQVPA